MNNTNEVLGNNIQFYRKKKCITSKELAEKLNTTPASVSNWERGIYQPDIESLIMLSQIFEISIDDLIGNQVKRYSADIETYNENILKEKFKSNNVSIFFKDLTILTEDELDDIECMLKIVKKRKKQKNAKLRKETLPKK